MNDTAYHARRMKTSILYEFSSDTAEESSQILLIKKQESFMKILHLFKINNWEQKSFIYAIIVIQLALWSTIGLECLGMPVSLLRQIIGFFYLVFVPGAILLRIMRPSWLSTIESTIFSIALSISFLIFNGFLINILFPIFGISHPLSLGYLLPIISFIVLILCYVCHILNRSQYDSMFVETEDINLAIVSLLFIIPIISIIGTFFVNNHNNNAILLILIISIAVLVFIIGFTNFVPCNLYPLAIGVIAVSLQYHDSLISSYINKYDIITESFFVNLVISDSFWNWNLYDNNNGSLATVILAPIFHQFCNIDITWIFKLIYPFLLSLVSIALYEFFKNKMSERTAFLSAFYFTSLNASYAMISALGKQAIAELFYVCFILLIFNKSKDKQIQKSVLLIIFAISIIVSHYGLSYILMFSLIFLSLVSIFFSKYSLYIPLVNLMPKKILSPSINFIFLFIIFTLAWFMYVSGSSIIDAIVHIGNHISNTIFRDFFNPETSRGLYRLAINRYSPISIIGRSITLISISFIFVGAFILLFFRQKNTKFELEYLVLSIFWLGICAAAIAISGFSVMNPDRLLHLALFFLAPLGVVGSMNFFGKICQLMRIRNTIYSQSHRNLIRCTSKISYLFFIIFFLFNVGFISEVLNDHPHSISISQKSVKEYGDILDKSLFFNLMYEQNVYNAVWLSRHTEEERIIYATKGNGEGASALVAYGMIPMKTVKQLINYESNDLDTLYSGAYIYLSHININEGIGIGYNPKLGLSMVLDATGMIRELENLNQIYDNGSSRDFYVI